MKNNLTDLNDHLFAQIERLSEEDLTPEELQKEVKRSKAMSQISSNIVNNAKVCLEAIKFSSDMPGNVGKMPDMIAPKMEVK